MTAPRTLAELVGEGMDAQFTFAHELYLRVDDGPLSAADQVALGAFLAMVAGGLTGGGGKI